VKPLLNKNQYKDLSEQCEHILRRLIASHAFLQPNNKKFDVWDNNDAAEVLADLIQFINHSDAIDEAHRRSDWGK
jgi:hypothetical protein